MDERVAVRNRECGPGADVVPVGVLDRGVHVPHGNPVVRVRQDDGLVSERVRRRQRVGLAGRRAARDDTGANCRAVLGSVSRCPGAQSSTRRCPVAGRGSTNVTEMLVAPADTEVNQSVNTTPDGVVQPAGTAGSAVWAAAGVGLSGVTPGGAAVRSVAANASAAVAAMQRLSRGGRVRCPRAALTDSRGSIRGPRPSGGGGGASGRRARRGLIASWPRIRRPARLGRASQCWGRRRQARRRQARASA